MAGTLKKIDAGEVLFHKGEPSDSMCAIISGVMDVVDLENADEPMKELGVYKQLNRAKAGEILGEMGLLRNMPRSATVIAAEPSEYLEINLKMIKRLQWLYPPTANRFFMNLMTILCNRIESLTNNFTGESIIDDLTGWYNRRGFVSVLETEMNRARRYEESLSLCLMGIDLEVANLKLSYEIKDRNLRMIGQTLSKLIRKCDSLGRLDAETFALLMPETPTDQAAPVCNRLRNLLMEKRMDVDGLQINVDLNIVAMDYASEKTAKEMLDRSEKNFASVRSKK
jgi:diguanylate cyclase (GGDEF)-like protein